jgi:hypothetical protein
MLGYTWGTSTFYSPSSYGRPSEAQPGKFDRIIVADCLWMPSQHENLTKTILTYLKPDSPSSCALVVAGFHTGREVVRSFFEVALGEYEIPESHSGVTKESAGIEVQGEQPCGGQKSNESDVKGRLLTAEIFEIDVDGLRRPWEAQREGETKDAAKRWCVVAVLVRG